MERASGAGERGVGSLVGGKLNRLASGIDASRYPCDADMLNYICGMNMLSLVDWLNEGLVVNISTVGCENNVACSEFAGYGRPRWMAAN